MKIGLIGIGQMGREMSVRLIDAGHDLVVWNRSPAAAGKLAGRARVAGRPQEAMDVEVVITMLADDAAVEAVWLPPPRRAEGGAPNHATGRLRGGGGGARPPGRARGRGACVAPPVCGGPRPPAGGDLDILPAGPPAPLERCRPVFQPLS